MTSSLNSNLLAAGGAYPAYEQQTFLGASIVNFTVSAGFGDSSSTLGIELAEDQYNKSDESKLGQGQDVYHNGNNDIFLPPPVGSPVFFTFGAKRAKVSDVFKKSFDDLYGTSVSTRSNNIGHDHFAFGGILQSYVQNKSTAGNPMYSVQVVDPREILSNIQLILNNYAGSTYGLPNILNIYGFLEFNSALYDNETFFKNPSKTSRLTKYKYDATSPNYGKYYYDGVDMYYDNGIPSEVNLYKDSIRFSFDASNIPSFPRKFPITGTGMSRRGPQGIPYYRIVQAINGMGGFDGPMPQEYKDAGYGGYINFRGLNYVVDLTGLPDLPQFYFLDYDQINILDLCLEICDATNHELFVTLLPVINHRACSSLYSYNNDKITKNEPQNIIAGIIKVNAIDKSKPPSLSAIKQYIDNLQNAGTPIENRDVGYELANNVTDKIVVGAQEVDMYYFTANTDRDQNYRKCGHVKWTLDASLAQQILPYYGKLGNKAVTIPKGFGSYQQILLDATSLHANGVKDFYVATEMELRAALISFERWSEFLVNYNDIYMESVENGDIRESIAAASNIDEENLPPVELSDNYAVTVPRSVWDTNQYETLVKYYDKNGIETFFPDLNDPTITPVILSEPSFIGDLPASTCNPPYGWPLYYKRATQIGLPQAGLTSIASVNTKIMTQLATLKSSGNDKEFRAVLNSVWKDLQSKDVDDLTPVEKTFYNKVKEAIDNPDKPIAFVEEMYNQLGPIVAGTERLARKNIENAKKIYNFLKNIAEECLGKKFLVKIPQRVNRNYDTSLTVSIENEIIKGPFGFVRRSVNKDPLASITSDDIPDTSGMSFAFLEPGKDELYGALRVELNPVTEEYEFNYIPDNQGGYYEFDLTQTAGGNSLVTNMGLAPIDADSFINENGRISAYVRFDDSQFLSFENLSKDSYTQQALIAGYNIPDISYQLENSSNPNDKFDTSSADNGMIRSVAFVKCEVDEKLYMPPLIYTRDHKIYGILNPKDKDDYSLIYSKPNKIFDPNTCTYKDSFRYTKRLYKPKAKEYVYTDIVKTFDVTKLDENNVYALITLPQRIVPTVTTRYRDSISEKINPSTYKHFLMMDTVQGLYGFDEPVLSSGERNLSSRFTNNKGFGVDAEAAIRKSFENLSFALPNKISAASPSPVYPDLVVLPLRSTERCYGPWLSSYVASDIVGGKMEFIKDENLAPWNYGGFEMMNEAGKLQAEFASSAMLTSERGGFVVPAAPSGISLARALLNDGPLVTNISVSVSQAGIRTTYKMDLYTASFGKMQKQVKDMITNISRNKQKQRDEFNAMVRKGIGKAQTNLNYDKIYKAISNGLKGIGVVDDYVAGNMGSLPIDISVFTVFNQKVPSYSFNGSSSQMYGDTSAGERGEYDRRIVEGSNMSSASLAHAVGMLNTNQEDFANKFYNSASSNVTDNYAPASFEPDHPNMSTVAKPALDFINYINKIDGVDDSEFTTWG